MEKRDYHEFKRKKIGIKNVIYTLENPLTKNAFTEKDIVLK